MQVKVEVHPWCKPAAADDRPAYIDSFDLYLSKKGCQYNSKYDCFTYIWVLSQQHDKDDDEEQMKGLYLQTRHFAEF